MITVEPTKGGAQPRLGLRLRLGPGLKRFDPSTLRE